MKKIWIYSSAVVVLIGAALVVGLMIRSSSPNPALKPDQFVPANVVESPFTGSKEQSHKEVTPEGQTYIPLPPQAAHPEGVEKVNDAN